VVVADHGYRPEKVGWFVVGTLIGSMAYFWLWARVVGFMPAKRHTIRPIGLAFLFDRLLPAFRIREEHYDIASFYRRTGKSRWASSHELENPDIATLKYLWFRIHVIKAGEKDAQRAEACLDFIKAVGLVLVIFLVAAINALVRH
jgi:hypothetical protein